MFRSMIAALTEDAAINALQTASTKYLELSGVVIPVLIESTNSLFETEATEQTAALVESAVGVRGTIAKRALTIMIESGDRLAMEAAENAVRDFSSVQEVEPITITLTGSYLLALAVVSKISYDSKKGLSVQPGFPGLAGVLEKAAKLISAAIGPRTKDPA